MKDNKFLFFLYHIPTKFILSIPLKQILVSLLDCIGVSVKKAKQPSFQITHLFNRFFQCLEQNTSAGFKTNNQRGQL